MWETIQYGMLFLLIAFFIYLMYKNDSSSKQNKTEYPNHYMNTKTKKKVCQVYCNDERGVNNWLKLNSDVEVVGINTTVDQDGELITVVYLIEEEEK